jgi:uncharacterized protein (TIGR00255 family)
MTNANKKTTLGSMTGFGTGQAADNLGRLQVQLRSVNSRFLELHFKIPDALAHYEPVLRDLLAASLKRGKVECRLSASLATDAARDGGLDWQRLAQLQAWQQQILQQFPKAQPLSVHQLLSFGGVQTDMQDQTDRQATLLIAAGQALADLHAQRDREGMRLGQVMHTDIDAIEAFVEVFAAQIGPLIAASQQRLVDKLTKAFKDVEQSQRVPEEEMIARIRQETAALGLRADVAEEIARLKSHCQEFRFCLNQGGIQGKRLDFLLQELNREANTLGSKAINAATTSAALGLKQRIEQLREQVQNIE